MARVMVPGNIQGGLTMGDGIRPSPVHDTVAQELGVLLRGHSQIDSVLNRRDVGPNRSGSAPPSFEDAFAVGGSLSRDSANNITNAGIRNDMDVIDSEQELRSDPAYLTYYYSNFSRNPRLPLPIVTRQNYLLAQRLAFSGLGDGRKFGAFDDNNGRSLFVAKHVLPTRNEEPESSDDGRLYMANLLRNTGKVADEPPGILGPSRPKSMVDLIQEDFPRTPSPVFNQSRSSSCVLAENVIDGVSVSEPQYASLRDSSLSANVIADLNAPLIGSLSTTPCAILTSHAAMPNPARSTTPNMDLSSKSAMPNPATTHLFGTTSAFSGPVAKTLTSNASVLASNSSSGITQLKSGNVANTGELAAALKGLSLSIEHGAGSLEQHDVHTPIPVQRQETSPSKQYSHGQVGSQTPLHSQALTQTLLQQQHPELQQFSGLDTSLRPPWRFPVPNPLQTGVTNSTYAAAAAAAAMSYVAANPFYRNMQAYGSHCGVGGYPLNQALIPALMANYPLPVTYDTTTAAAVAAAAATSNLAARRTPVLGSDLQQLYHYASQTGSMPSYLQDPLYYQYLLHCSSPDSLDATRSYLSLMLGQIGENSDLKGSGKSSLVAAGSFPLGQADQIHKIATSLGKTDPGSNGISWHGPKLADTGEMKGSSLLEELKNNKTQKFELADILGHVVEFSVDQHGSRFIQQKLEIVSLEEKASVFQEVLPHALSLMTDVFGNYVIQKFFEHGTSEQMSELVNHLVGNVLNLSIQMYGCRIIQKSLEVVPLKDQIQLISELDGHVMRCVRDQNGNHVIQKCIECVPPEHIDFIISSFYGQVVMLSTHPYGCRVIQRVLEHGTDDQKQGIMEEILSSVCTLALDQYGNYVVQHILEHGKERERSEILAKLAGQIVQMSQHKFASNVVEKCLEFGGPKQRQILITEMLGDTDENEPLQVMMKDQYANYVVQKVLETCDDQQREMLLSRIRIHLHALKKYTYGKHIVARVEKLVVTGERHGSQAP